MFSTNNSIISSAVRLRIIFNDKGFTASPECLIRHTNHGNFLHTW